MSDPYDVNFCFPVRELQNDKVKLTPFIPSLHAESWFTASRDHPELYDWVPFGPFDAKEHWVKTVIEERIQPDPGTLLFAVFDKVKAPPESSDFPLAGHIGLLNTSVENLMTEVAFVFTIPAYRKSYVTSNSIGLLLHWCLDLPADGGLGLRRVQWQCNELNVASRRAAERMGFKFEGVERWQRSLPSGKQGPTVTRDDPKKQYPGRHTVRLALCWDGWDEARELVRKQMNRI
ncbi:unnamed protein product [Somion occarium]|uniref:N-acetyltransferase domain-containing protein n=1 Tax=Somion occarium TaxID=3059160 RepID=A0ABP1D3X1_9APHY